METLTSFDTRPSISSLQLVEQQIVTLLEIASSTTSELSKIEPNQSVIEKLNTEYLTLVKRIKDSLSTQIQRIGVEVPYQRTIYGIEKDAEISFMKVKMISEQLQQLTKLIQQQTQASQLTQ